MICWNGLVVVMFWQFLKGLERINSVKWSKLSIVKKFDGDVCVELDGGLVGKQTVLEAWCEVGWWFDGSDLGVGLRNVQIVLRVERGVFGLK